MNKNKILLLSTLICLALFLPNPLQAKTCNNRFARNYELRFSYTSETNIGKNRGSCTYLTFPHIKVSEDEVQFIVNDGVCGIFLFEDFPHEMLVSNDCSELSIPLPFITEINLIDNGKVIETKNVVFNLNCKGFLRKNKNISGVCNGTQIVSGTIGSVAGKTSSITVNGTITTKKKQGFFKSF